MESSQTERKFVRQKENHPLQEKQKLGALVEKLKKECDKEKKALDGKTWYDYKRKKRVPMKPKERCLAAAVTKFYTKLENATDNF